jgi:hypothetical protein
MLVTTVKPNWRAYFASFCDKHGPPVNYTEGRILFQDGWQYNSLSHSGPEFPPPNNLAVLYKLKHDYWLIRSRIIQEQINKGENQLRYFKHLEETRDVPVYGITRVKDEDSGQYNVTSDLVNLQQLESELKILDEELAECWSHINKLQAKQMPVMR